MFFIYLYNGILNNLYINKTFTINKKMSTDSKSPTLNETAINTPRNEILNLSPKKRVNFKPPRKTMSTPILSLQSANKIRKDIFGEIIKKGGKQKISFADDALFHVNENEEDSEYMSEQNKNNVFKVKKEFDGEDVCCETCEIF